MRFLKGLKNLFCHSFRLTVQKYYIQCNRPNKKTKKHRKKYILTIKCNVCYLYIALNAMYIAKYIIPCDPSHFAPLYIYILAPLQPTPFAYCPPRIRGGWRGMTLRAVGSLASVRTLSELNQKSEHIENQIVANLNGLRKYIYKRT